MPLGAAISLGVIVVGAIGLILLSLRSDLKRKYMRNGEVALGSLRSSESITVDVALPTSQARQKAEDVIRVICAHDPVVVEGNVVVAWTDAPLLGFGWAPQQVAVQVVPLSEERTRLLCYSRPRFALTVRDLGRGRRIRQEFAFLLQTRGGQ